MLNERPSFTKGGSDWANVLPAPPAVGKLTLRSRVRGKRIRARTGIVIELDIADMRRWAVLLGSIQPLGSGLTRRYV